MRQSQTLVPTLKEAPSEAEVPSHIFMVRGGYLRKVAAGIYSFLPLGWRVVKKVERIIREEMDRAGASEVFLPAVIPAELWKESGRWQNYGDQLLRFKDRKGGDFVIGPTHEEVISALVRGEVRSWRQLPLNLYQIQTKFRDELRPRAGLMRGREFIMKDAYSFHVDVEGRAARVQEDVRDLPAHLHALRAGVPRRRGGHRQHRRLAVARVPGADRDRRGRAGRLRQLRLRGQRRAGGRARAEGASPRRRRRDEEGRHARQAQHRRRVGVPEGRRPTSWSRR